jgi:hypothetical protein
MSHRLFEIRQYTLVPGRRDELIELFDRHFLDGQTECGIEVLGQFRVHDEPNRFFWLRSFSDAHRRTDALDAFYLKSPVWQLHKKAANATMVDSDNVLQLRALDASRLLDAREGIDTPARCMVAVIYHPERAVDDTFIDLFEHGIRPIATAAGADVLASFAGDATPNGFPALPVREGIETFAWFAALPSYAEFGPFLARMKADSRMTGVREAFALAKNYASPEVWALDPTPRSRLR